MFENLWLDCVAWWGTVSAEFAFLLALPFFVAALGLARDGWRRDATD